MTYSVEPTRVSRRSKAPIVLLLGLAVAVVGFATLSERPPAAAAGSPVAAAAPTVAPAEPSAALVARNAGTSARPAPTQARAGLGRGDDGLLGPLPAPVGTRWTPPRPFGVAVVPDIVRCHGIVRDDCLRLANAAAGAIVAAGEDLGAIRTVDVWPSLLCADSLVCPVPLLRSVVPLGSAVLSIDGASRDAWVNVGSVRVPPFRSPAEATPPVDGAGPPPLEAWIVR